MNDYIPTEEEFEIILAALDYYGFKAKSDISDDEVLKATMRLAQKANKAVTENEKAFEDAFGTKEVDPFNGINNLIADLSKEIDTKAIQTRMVKAKEDLTLLSAKMIRLREQTRAATTSKAISNLLNP